MYDRTLALDLARRDAQSNRNKQTGNYVPDDMAVTPVVTTRAKTKNDDDAMVMSCTGGRSTRRLKRSSDRLQLRVALDLDLAWGQTK